MQQYNWIVKIALIFIFFIFASLSFYQAQYWLCVIILVLPIVTWRIDDLIKLSVSKGGINLILDKERKKMSKTIQSNQSVEQKIEVSQKIIDEVFQLGYTLGSGKIREINNVKIWADKNGGKNIQYDER
jgi:hypothetical protein